MQKDNQGRAVGAIILIGLGVLFLLQQIFDFSLFGDSWWTLLILIPGLVFLFFAVTGDPGMSALAIPGAIVTGTGAILLFQSITNRWESWAYIWTLYPVFLGLGLIHMGQRTNNKSTYETGRGFVQWGLIGFVVFGAFFELLIFGGFSGFLGRFTWPALLILLGLFLFFRSSRRRRISDAGEGFPFSPPKRKPVEDDEAPLFTGAPVVGTQRPTYAPSASDRLRRDIDAALSEPVPPVAPVAPVPPIQAEPEPAASAPAADGGGTVEFYDVKLRHKVSVPLSVVVKTTFSTDEGQVRYGLRGKTPDGRNLTKFVSKADWEALNVPED